MTRNYRQAIENHLANYFTGPLPTELIDGCIQAIRACRAGDQTRLIVIAEESWEYDEYTEECWVRDEVTSIAGELVEDLELGKFL